MKIINSTKLSDTITLSECNDGFWLHDATRGMNLSMRAKSATVAFTEALTYYQKRLTKIETDYTNLHLKVDLFVSQFVEPSGE